MDGRILVTYASKYGATAQIAEKIGEVLCQAGLPADTLPVDQVRDLSPYQTVIVGSAIYIGKWQKAAEAFLNANEKRLAQQKVWVFSSGPTGRGDPVELVEGQRVPNNLQAVIGRVHPRDITVFHGYNNPEKMNAVEKFAIERIVKKPFGDFRDWDMITAWANQIVKDLKYPWSEH